MKCNQVKVREMDNSLNINKKNISTKIIYLYDYNLENKLYNLSKIYMRH